MYVVNLWILGLGKEEANPFEKRCTGRLKYPLNHSCQRRGHRTRTPKLSVVHPLAGDGVHHAATQAAHLQDVRRSWRPLQQTSAVHLEEYFGATPERVGRGQHLRNLIQPVLCKARCDMIRVSFPWLVDCHWDKANQRNRGHYH